MSEGSIDNPVQPCTERYMGSRIISVRKLQLLLRFLQTGSSLLQSATTCFQTIAKSWRKSNVMVLLKPGIDPKSTRRYCASVFSPKLFHTIHTNSQPLRDSESFKDFDSVKLECQKKWLGISKKMPYVQTQLSAFGVKSKPIRWKLNVNWREMLFRCIPQCHNRLSLTSTQHCVKTTQILMTRNKLLRKLASSKLRKWGKEKGGSTLRTWNNSGRIGADYTTLKKSIFPRMRCAELQ